MGLEGGSGLGALSLILSPPGSAKRVFPQLSFPQDYNTPVLKAAYIFSFLSCYLITHAHLDHTLSLIMLTGSIPPRPNLHPQPPQAKSPLESETESRPSRQSQKNKAPQASNGPSGEEDVKAKPPRPPIYATRDTLERLAGAYGGGLWPELGTWAAPAPSASEGTTFGFGSEAPNQAAEAGTTKKRRRDTGNFGVTVEMGKEKATDHSGPGVVFTPCVIPPSLATGLAITPLPIIRPLSSATD